LATLEREFEQTGDTFVNVPRKIFLNVEAEEDVDVKFTQVACGEVHCCAVDTKGQVYSWGWGEFGQLGLDPAAFPSEDSKRCFTPKKIDGAKYFHDRKIREVKCGGAFSVAVTVCSAVVAGSQKEVVTGATSSKKNIDHENESSAGASSSSKASQRIAVEDGREEDNELLTGDVDLDLRRHVESTTSTTQPTSVTFDGLYSGSQGGQVYAWGTNDRGQVAQHPSKVFEQRTPHHLLALAHTCVVEVSCGLHHTLALDVTGRVFAWGSNSHGQLGTRSLPKTRQPPPVFAGSQEFECAPQPLQALSRIRICKVAAGREHSVLLT
ncbi:unnamed protein product, partial [Amoebophrya sp. A120]